MKLKAIALDMDGTLLDANNQISEKGIELLKEFHDRGIYIFISTGRSKESVDHVLPDHFPFDGMVTSNGAGCYIKDEVLVEASLAIEEIEEVLSIARDYQMYYEIHPFEGAPLAYQKDKDYIEELLYSDPGPTVLEYEINWCREAFESQIHWVDHLPNTSLSKVYFFHKDLAIMQNFIKALKQFEEEGKFTPSSSTEHNVEIVHANVTKATGLKHFLKRFEISPSELIVFGDGENDFPMFKLAKRAVAMKNAPAFVKEKADDVTDDTNDELGVFRYLEKHKSLFYFSK